MAFSLIHSADWQIGRTYRFVDEATQGRLASARLDAISSIGRTAARRQVTHVVVAGDVFDSVGVADRTIAQVIERLRPFEGVHWHLIPGNHDPDVAGGPWERLARLGAPAHVRLHLEDACVELEPDLWLLASPYSTGGADPTAWMDAASTPPGVIRIGLAHGSITDFGSERPASPPIAPDRTERANLDYLALGDWHGFRPIGPRTAYAGTPEPDRFDQADAGFAVMVEIEAQGSPPSIMPFSTRAFSWCRERATLQSAADVDILDMRLRALAEDLQYLLVDLEVDGVLGLDDRALFDRRIGQAFAAAVCHLRLRDEALLTAPRADDVDAIAKGGVLRTAAQALQAMAADPGHAEHDLAARALVRLRLECERLGSG